MTKLKKKKLRLYLYIALFVVLFFFLYVLSSLSGLRFFIPHYFNMAGGPFSEKNYIVLFQNNNELRPTGGFISAYGVAKFKNGFFKGIEINDVFGDIDDHEYIDPPYPQKELMDGPFYQGYTFRDANYYADFPQSVSEIMRLYRLTDSETNFDGVIAVNLKVMEDLLDILDKIRVGDLEFTSGNVFELLEFSLHNIDHHDVEEVAKRKNILGPLAKALIKKSVFSPLKWREISDMVVRNLNEKHIQFHFFNSSFQDAIHNKGWSGTWPSATGDFFAVVESNLGGMKSDRYIQRDVNYRLEIFEDENNGNYTLTGKIRINMEHFGDYNVPISGKYKGYLRIYVPKGSSLQNANLSTQTEQLSDYTVFGTIVNLNPGEQKTLEYTYKLPSALFDGETYHLDIPKQAGTDADNYSVVIEAPQGLIIDGDDFETRENFAIWEGGLIRDLSLDFKIEPDKIGPRIAYSNIQDLNTILVVFNERVDPDALADPLNITIEDTDKKDRDNHDTIKIKSVRVDFRDLWIEIEGMTEQYEEFYKLTIKNGFDLHGNSIEPSPKEITFVQRLE
ncbi:DUF4012 domain-containing protein [Patescibacteria group bacterium]